jgi:hypothetical protein
VDGGEQGYPAEADSDREQLEQPGQPYQSCGLLEASTGGDERDHENESSNGRVDRLSALASRGEPAAEHEAGGRQRHEGGERDEVVEGAVPAVPRQSVGRAGRIAVHGIGHEDPRAEQIDRPYSDEQ